MLVGDDDNEFGTAIALLQYELLGRPKGNTIKGVFKWWQMEYLSMDKRFKIRKLNRKYVKLSLKGKLRDYGTAQD